MVRHEDRKRIEALASDVWTYVFERLDAEPDTGTDTAGKAATAAETAVRRVLEAAFSVAA